MIAVWCNLTPSRDTTSILQPVQHHLLFFKVEISFVMHLIILFKLYNIGIPHIFTGFKPGHGGHLSGQFTDAL